MKVVSYGNGVSAILDRHPETGADGLVAWVEVNGVPRRMTAGGVDTYPSFDAAKFAAKCTAARLGRSQKMLRTAGVDVPVEVIS